MSAVVEKEGASIVVVGQFNPSIFQPQWFAREGLLRPSEADEAALEVVHGEVTNFSTAWFQLLVTRDRFTVTTFQQHSHAALRDLIVGAFQLLKHTPTLALGLNADMHFRMRDVEEWHQIGRRFAPPAPWEGFLEQPGMASVAMRGPRTSGPLGYVEYRIEPSQMIKPNGVFVLVNNHYAPKDGTPYAPTTDWLLAVLASEWSTVIKHSQEQAMKLVSA